MEEPKIVPVPDPVVAKSEGVDPQTPAVVEPSVAKATHEELAPPPGNEGIMTPVLGLNHAEAVKHGAIEQFPKVKDITGDSIKITPPVGIVDLQEAQRGRNSKTKEWRSWASTLFIRQGGHRRAA